MDCQSVNLDDGQWNGHLRIVVGQQWVTKSDKDQGKDLGSTSQKMHIRVLSRWAMAWIAAEQGHRVSWVLLLEQRLCSWGQMILGQ